MWPIAGWFRFSGLMYSGQKRPYGSFFLLSWKCAHFDGLFKNYHLDKCRSKRNKRQRFAKRKVNENKRHKMFCTTWAAIWQFSSSQNVLWKRRKTVWSLAPQPEFLKRARNIKGYYLTWLQKGQSITASRRRFVNKHDRGLQILKVTR